MTFEKALKAFLRQDPDIILVGEIRDIGTASIAVKAAQTGHMVMSTLHTNDSPQTLTRLQDMGIQAFAVATSINLITAQRLLRRLSTDNRVPIERPDDSLRDEGFSEDMIKAGISLFGPGDDTEDNPAYKGRCGIYQIMPISDAMKRLIIEGANAVQLADQAAEEGIWDIRRSGLQKAADGITSLVEVITLPQSGRLDGCEQPQGLPKLKYNGLFVVVLKFTVFIRAIAIQLLLILYVLLYLTFFKAYG